MPVQPFVDNIAHCEAGDADSKTRGRAGGTTKD
jgi:hypothetical protein